MSTHYGTGNLEHRERLENDTVLIAGGGPVGLVLATVLASFGVKSVLLERNKSTTRRVATSCTAMMLPSC
jgi:2-polyprenyl-6-methoxyphenol hydroxylase-like FAD-dependent oxidoreductase